METTKLIEQYLEGSLGTDELKAFECRLEREDNFRKLVTLHREVNECISDHDFTEFTVLAKKADEDYFSSGTYRWDHQFTGKRRNVWPLIKIASAVLLFLSLGILYKSIIFSGDSTEKIYTKFYTTYGADIVLRSGSNENTTLETALQEYSNKDYNLAFIDFSAITAADPANCIALFYLGLTCLERDDPASAIHSFKGIPESWNSPFVEHRNWYLALALIKENKTAEAGDILRQIDNEGGFYAIKAEKIIKKLRL